MALRLWLGTERVNVRWHAEIDDDASRVLKTWWPDVPNLGDFTAPGFWESASRADLHAGGIPCQPFSAAGRQRGEADARHLWPAWREGIALQRPATVVFENVANLARGKMRPIFDSIVTDLLDLGYDVRWCLLGACAVGAAHHRHRVFLLACRSRTTSNARQIQVQTCGQHVAAYLPTPSAVNYGSNQGGAAGRTGPVRHSLDSLARLELLPTTRGRDWKVGGYEDTLSAAAVLLPTPANADGRGDGWIDYRVRLEGNGNADGRDRPALSSAVQPERWGKYAEAIARHEAVLGRPAPEPTEIGPRGGRRLAAAFSEWLMMLPAGHLTSVLERNPALARAGNGVVPLQAATALNLLFSDLVRA